MSVVIAKNNILATLRRLISEVRCVSSSKKLKESLFINHIFSQYRKYKVTDQHLCKAQEEMKLLAQTYVCYLRSQREYNELHEQYLSKGERSVESTAKLVGFKLPHES